MSENTDLKSAMLVCRRWNEVISSSTNLMRGFTLQIVDSSLEVLEYPIFIRHYQSFEVYKLSEENFDLCIGVLIYYRPYLKVITFHGTFPKNRLKRISLLHACRNAGEIRFYNITGTSFTKLHTIRNASSYDFPNLKSLSIIDRPQHVRLFSISLYQI